MKESSLIKNIRYILVHRYLSGEVPVWHVDDMLAEMAAIILPFIDNISPSEEEAIIKMQGGTLHNINKELSTFLRKTKNKNLLEYLYPSLVSYLKGEWAQMLSMDNRIKLVKDISLVQQVETDGYIALKYNEKVYEAIEKQGTEELNISYGNKVYEVVVSNDEFSAFKESKSHAEKKKSISTHNVEKSEEENTLDTFWVKNKLPLTLKTGEYFWNYKIPQSTYDEIKGKLQGLNFKENRNRIKPYASHIALFLAEWYKREYNGHEGGNGLVQIGLEPTDSQRVWGNANLPENYLYNSGQKEWLFSMYVFGGFPLKYICDGNRFNNLFREIWSIQQEDTIDESTINKISKSFDGNNSVYKQSLENGSFRNFIKEIVNSDFPIAEEDMSTELFISIKQLLEQGKKQFYDKFFSDEWFFYTSAEDEECDCEFRLKIGHKKDRCYISCECLRHWSIADWDSKKNFILGLQLEDGTKSRSTIRFSKAGGPGTAFVGWSNSCYLSIDIPLNILGKIDVMMYEIEDTGRESGVLITSFSSKEYYHLFSTGRPYEWSTLTDSTAQSALLYSPIKHSIKDAKIEVYCKNAGDNIWNWTYLYENLILTNIDANEDISIRIKKGCLGVEFNYIENTILYNANKEIKYVTVNEDGEKYEESLHLLLGYAGIKRVVLYPFEEGKTEVTYKPKDKDISIKFKQGNFNFQDFTEKNQPHVGKVKLRVSNNNHIKELNCFYMPEKFIKRDLKNKQIISNIEISVPNADDEFIPILPNDSKRYVYNDIDYRDSEDTIPMRIGSEGEYAVIDVYRARECKELYLQNNRIKIYDNADEIVEVPYILCDKLDIRTIDKDGVRRDKAEKELWFEHNFNRALNNLHNETITDDKIDVKFYLYANRDIKNKGKGYVNLGKTGIDQYKFYYWNMSSDREPILLETKYDSSTEEFVIPTDNLAKGGIIFQSLKDVVPRHYLKPIYPDDQVERTGRYADMKTLIACLEIACEHKVYFSQFYPLKANLKKSSDMIDFLANYFQCKNHLELTDYQYLHRFANEFIFDWMLLPHSEWRKKFKKEDKDSRSKVNQLFRTGPFVKTDINKAYIEKIIEHYWTLPNSVQWIFRRSDFTSNIFMQCLRNKQGDIALLPCINSENNISVLKSIHEDAQLCHNVFNFINEKKINQ